MAWQPAVSTQGRVPEGGDSSGEQGRNGNVGSLPVMNTLLSEQTHLQSRSCSTSTSAALPWSCLLPPAPGLVCVAP